MQIWDYISISIVGCVMYPMMRFIQTSNPIHLIFAGGLYTTEFITKIIKLCYNPRNNPQILARPKNAFNCDVFCREGSAEGKPGMPSGHVATATYFAIYFICVELKGKYYHYGSFLSVAYCIAMATARLRKHCHNGIQVIMGAIIGASMGILTNIVVRR